MAVFLNVIAEQSVVVFRVKSYLCHAGGKVLDTFSKEPAADEARIQISLFYHFAVTKQYNLCEYTTIVQY